MNNVYMLRDHTDGHIRRESGRIYDVDTAKAAQLVSEGCAVKADFPTLNNYQMQINRAVEAYRSHADQIDKNVVLSPHERQYRVLEARDKLDETVAALKQKYQTELQALSIVAAQDAFKTEPVTPEAKAFVDGVLINLRTSNPEDVAALLRAQLPAMDGPTKTELLRRYDEVKTLAGDKAKHFDAMVAQLKTGDSGLQYKILTQIQKDHTPDVMYDQLTKTHRTYKDGYLAAEVSGQYKTDREYALKAGE
ncbi:hypothetical protein [Paenibacillus sp. HGF5]|uniref:hypothetical protein n=1 Tax=Paenibacillus sp. HGF5 TaxID=908341 RepID=UPI0002072A1F|nr:hypothetical protein [Paenibacillus sp. HGF5]EGG36534.1 hypothetical protein HMPREF9412_6584 [Paenibacillus sp. HGF5]